MLLKMADGGIEDVWSDQRSYSGCETCDYGSSYVTEVDITMTNGKIHIETDSMYDYSLSIGDMMGIMLPNVALIENMTECEFANWLKDHLPKKTEYKYTPNQKKSK